MRMRLYLSGPMRGYPGFNFSRFDEVRDALKCAGWEVISPADSDRTLYPNHDFSMGTYPEGWNIEKVLEADFLDVAKCDGIYLLDGWHNSVGAKRELAVALAAGKRVFVEGELGCPI